MLLAEQKRERKVQLEKIHTENSKSNYAHILRATETKKDLRVTLTKRKEWSEHLETNDYQVSQ